MISIYKNWNQIEKTHLIFFSLYFFSRSTLLSIEDCSFMSSIGKTISQLWYYHSTTSTNYLQFYNTTNDTGDYGHLLIFIGKNRVLLNDIQISSIDILLREKKILIFRIQKFKTKFFYSYIFFSFFITLLFFSCMSFKMGLSTNGLFFVLLSSNTYIYIFCFYISTSKEIKYD